MQAGSVTTHVVLNQLALIVLESPISRNPLSELTNPLVFYRASHIVAISL